MIFLFLIGLKKLLEIQLLGEEGKYMDMEGVKGVIRRKFLLLLLLLLLLFLLLRRKGMTLQCYQNNHFDSFAEDSNGPIKKVNTHILFFHIFSLSNLPLNSLSFLFIPPPSPHQILTNLYLNHYTIKEDFLIKLPFLVPIYI